jgi:prepilin-type N-terminal cleavage/methylation domain-containing protein
MDPNMRTPSGRHLPRAGFSLVEMLIVIVLAGLMMALAMPKLRQGLVMRDVQSARAAVANMYARARVNALQSRKSSTVHFSGTEVWVTAPLGAGLDTVGAVVNLTNAYGVAVNASAGTITVLPTGLANMPSTVTVRVTRSGKSDSVMISGYGRLQ